MPVGTSSVLIALTALVRKHGQLFWFGLIGIMNTLIHGGALMLAVELLRINVILSHLLAFFCANIFSYFMNSWLTFRAPLSLVRYARFFLTSMLALFLTLLLAWLADRYGLGYLSGFILIVFLVPFLSFFVMKCWAFSRDNDFPPRQ